MTLFEKIKDLTGDSKSFEHYAREECIYDYWPLEGHFNDEETSKICGSGCDSNKCRKCWNQRYIGSDDSKETKTNNNVDHPEYYQGKRECIEEMRLLFGDEAVKGFCRCSVYKYNFRSGKKDGESAEKDKAKAEWYIEYIAKMEQEEK